MTKIEERMSEDYPKLLTPEEYQIKLKEKNEFTEIVVESYAFMYNRLVDAVLEVQDLEEAISLTIPMK